MIVPKMLELDMVRYQSPEYLDNKLTLKSDTWSFGCLLIEIATGIKPYENINDLADLKKTVL
jgi:serine/threonine protein kinase